MQTLFPDEMESRTLASARRLSCGKVLLHEIGDKRSACARAGSVRMHGQKMPPRLVSRRARSLPPRGVSQGKKNTEKKGRVCSLLASGVFIVTQNFAPRVEKYSVSRKDIVSVYGIPSVSGPCCCVHGHGPLLCHHAPKMLVSHADTDRRRHGCARDSTRAARAPHRGCMPACATD